MGLGARLDTAVFSSELGKRKPHPAIFEAALERLGVDPERALFVGDRRYEDVRGSKELGMTTVQAYWFRADDDERGLDPDFEAFTPMDVLNVVRRLNGEL
jgi:putative hydrolase of the HAD superfamily